VKVGGESDDWQRMDEVGTVAGFLQRMTFGEPVIQLPSENISRAINGTRRSKKIGNSKWKSKANKYLMDKHYWWG